MSIETQSNKVWYLGDGAAREFPVPYPVSDWTHLKLYLFRNGHQSEMTAGYTVRGAGSGVVAVELDAPLAAGTRLTIMREVPYVQPMDLMNGGAFNADTLEGSADNIVMQVQQLAEVVERAVTYPESSEPPYPDSVDYLDEIKAWAEDARTSAERAAQLADSGALASGIYNIRKAWSLAEDIEAGGVLTMPDVYFPTRNVLSLYYKGVLCILRGPLVENSAKYEYEEIGDDLNETSNQVRLFFEAKAGDVFDMHVTHSGLSWAVEAAEAAQEAAETAQGLAETAQTAAEAAQAGAESARTGAEAAEDGAAAARAGAQAARDSALDYRDASLAAQHDAEVARDFARDDADRAAVSSASAGSAAQDAAASAGAAADAQVAAEGARDEAAESQAAAEDAAGSAGTDAGRAEDAADRAEAAAGSAEGITIAPTTDYTSTDKASSPAGASSNIAAKIAPLATDISLIKTEMANTEHFRGYYEYTAQIAALPNPKAGDYAYSADTLTKWIYNADTPAWEDSGVKVPDQITELSDGLPLSSGTASAGTSGQASRSDHVHGVSHLPVVLTQTEYDALGPEKNTNNIIYLIVGGGGG